MMDMMFPLIFFTVLALIIGVFLYIIIKGIGTWIKNNNSPIISVDAIIIAKRTHVSGGGNNTSSHTSYYMTFELPNNDRLELRVTYKLYGMSAEKDEGKLTYQGTRFKEWIRKR